MRPLYFGGLLLLTMETVLVAYFLAHLSPKLMHVARKSSDYDTTNSFGILRPHARDYHRNGIADMNIFDKGLARDPTMDTRWPRRVLYIWCGKGEFTFVNFLSVQSVIRSISPSAIMFAYEHYPTAKNSYKSWLQDVEENFPFWIKQSISKSEKLCSKASVTSGVHIQRFVKKHNFEGCLFVGSKTVVVEPFKVQIANETINYYNKGQGLLYVPKRPKRTQPPKDAVCKVVNLTENNMSDVCFIMNSHLKPRPMDPEDIMFSPLPVAAQLRLILYGSREYPVQMPDKRDPAPNMAHYVWLGGSQMKFTFFMSVLSTLFLGKVDKVFVHGNKPLWGKHWTKLQEMNLTHRIQYVPWHRPNSIFGGRVHSIQNQADLLKSSIMFSLGGILMDPDVMFVRAPDPELFHYEALISVGGQLHMLNPAVAISKPKSQYARLWMESEKNFKGEKYIWNCCIKMYKVWERQPRIAKVVRNFTLVSWNKRYYPMWLDRNAMANKHDDLMQNVSDWKRDVVTIHYAQPNPYHSFEECANELQGIVGELGRMILRAAGLLGSTEGLVP